MFEVVFYFVSGDPREIVPPVTRNISQVTMAIPQEYKVKNALVRAHGYCAPADNDRPGKCAKTDCQEMTLAMT